ncbi:hypothetical protein RUM4293_01485 [Ruegeria atlantica]|uniref:Uncharacterized protein n=1 Tax=Ruegeria atlantica TaxID=81569 RepID=A0A0P1E5G9_9RHOB|nr:hypothetical protein RUM4293_01485 [Ruegeria atlantica]
MLLEPIGKPDLLRIRPMSGMRTLRTLLATQRSAGKSRNLFIDTQEFAAVTTNVRFVSGGVAHYLAELR